MSHEIRTPLNGILGMAQLLEASKLTKEQREYVFTLKASGNVLVALVDDILDFARLEADALTLTSNAFDPVAVAHRVIVRFRPEAARRGLSIECQPGADVPTLILGDGARLEQVLGKLLSNAVKFTISGTITITVNVETDEQGMRTLVLAVLDTGIGIPEDRHKDLFRAFSQVDSSTTRAYGGAGLGLAIAARLVKAMGGSIGLESGSRIGSRFWIHLPLQEPQSRSATPAAVTREDASSRMEANVSPKSILLVESNAINLLLTSRLLKRAGHKVDTVTNSSEAAERAQHATYDVILINVSVPAADDEIAAIRQIRHLSLENQPRIIALSERSSIEAEACFIAAGADCHITKPVAVAQLYRLITG